MKKGAGLGSRDVCEQQICKQSDNNLMRSYWAGGLLDLKDRGDSVTVTMKGPLELDLKERGDPVTVKTKGLSELPKGVQTAACPQVMYERAARNTDGRSGRCQPPQAPP